MARANLLWFPADDHAVFETQGFSNVCPSSLEAVAQTTGGPRYPGSGEAYLSIGIHADGQSLLPVAHSVSHASAFHGHVSDANVRLYKKDVYQDVLPVDVRLDSPRSETSLVLPNVKVAVTMRSILIFTAFTMMLAIASANPLRRQSDNVPGVSSHDL